MPSPYRLAVFSKRFKSLQLAGPPEQNPEYGPKQLDLSLSHNAHRPKAYADPTRLPDMRPSQGLVVSAPSSDLLVEEVVRVSDDGGTVALSLYTTGPYVEFRRSMQEMVDAHQPLGRGFMKELLLCYLKMNEKKQHKLILAAFFDLMDTLETNCRIHK